MSSSDSEHESAIKTPQQLITIVVLAFVVPVILLIMLAQFVLSARDPSDAVLAPEAVATRIKPVAEITLAAAGGAAGAAKSGEEIVKGACAACHATGAANAPKIGDKGRWAPLVARGVGDLTKSAIKGKGGMPARGGLPDLSDFEISRAIVFMANQSGGSLKEPAEPKAGTKSASK